MVGGLFFGGKFENLNFFSLPSDFEAQYLPKYGCGYYNGSVYGMN